MYEILHLTNFITQEIENSDARHFVILFRDYHLQYRGVYSYTSETDYIEKVIGQGPPRISEDMIEKYYK
jgi:calmodulin-regulated spectrin-associated protein